jgi:phosphoenolpyruvate phosphomutase
MMPAPTAGQAADLLRTPRTGVGVHDGLSAMLASSAGYDFDFLWVSSFGTSAASALPDAGLLDAGDMARTVAVVGRASRLPVVADMETGYGDPLKVGHAAAAIVRAGATAVCIEDNTIAKRSSLYSFPGRTLVPADEHCERVRAAVGATRDHDCAVIARTEALVAGLGVDDALGRAGAYVDAGAQAIFVQSVSPDMDELLCFCRAWGGRTPVFVAPTCYPEVGKSALRAVGVTHYIFANQAIRAAHRAMTDVLVKLSTAECAAAVEGQISAIADMEHDCGPAALRVNGGTR